MELQELNEVIYKFREPYVLNKYKKRNRIVIKKFIDKLQEKKQILKELLNKENETWNTNFSIERIFDTLLVQYNNIEDKKFGIGNIVAITNGDVYLQIDLIIKAIISNCRIVFISPPIAFNFNLYIVSIIKEILKEENLEETLVSLVNSLEYKKIIIENKKYIDCIIINKEYEEYSYFIKNIDSKVIYLDYGNINVYVDSDEFEYEIKEIIKEANSLEMDVYKYNINNLEEFFLNEINNFVFNTVVIFSKDIKKCIRLYEYLKANNVFINKFDVRKIEIGLKIDDLQFEKNLVINE